MYDMYPDYGHRVRDSHPAADDDSTSRAARPTWSRPLQESLDRRDNGGERRDDD